jgi:hypothetical protein
MCSQKMRKVQMGHPAALAVASRQVACPGRVVPAEVFRRARDSRGGVQFALVGVPDPTEAPQPRGPAWEVQGAR